MTTPTMQRLARNVTKLRKQKKLIQRHLGDKAGLTQSTISLIEMYRGDNVPVSTVEKIAQALEVDPADLLWKEIEVKKW